VVDPRSPSAPTSCWTASAGSLPVCIVADTSVLYALTDHEDATPHAASDCPRRYALVLGRPDVVDDLVDCGSRAKG
jgi:hypothetical protein